MKAPLICTAVVSVSAIWSSSALALSQGNYAVRCGPAEGAVGEQKTFDIRMDVADILTLRNSLGNVITGIRLDDGRRVILTGDRSCALVEVENTPRR
jgi:hypothetical protein